MSRSTCGACGETFTSVSAFDMHRTGEHSGKAITKGGKVVGYEPGTRRCKSIEDMAADGMTKTDKGIWSTGWQPDRNQFSS